MPETNITALIEEFAAKLVAATEAAASERIHAALSAAFGTPVKRGPGRPKQTVAPVAKPAGARRKMRLTPKLLAARRVQGQYLGALRSLNQANRAKVKSVAKDKGVPAALKLALSLKK